MLVWLGIFIVSLALLIWASDRFVDAAEDIGLGLGISPFIIGLTIVAFGTSLPELAASLAAVFSGQSGIVLGNAVGSNITNILLVLGLTCILGREIVLDYDVLDGDMPQLVGSALLLFFILKDGQVEKFECLLLLAGLVIFLCASLTGRDKEHRSEHRVHPRSYFILPLAIAGVFLGAKYTIDAIEHLSLEMGISQEVIALTIVALGTSLPEVVVSVMAARKGKSAIAVGNVLGSNIFNTYAVIGIPGLITSLEVAEDIKGFGILFMLAVTGLFLLITLSKRISRWEGFMLVIFYTYYIARLV